MFYPIEQQSHEYAQAEKQWLGRTHGQWCHEDCECQQPYEMDPDPEWVQWADQLDKEIAQANRDYLDSLTHEQYNAYIDDIQEEYALRYDATDGHWS